MTAGCCFAVFSRIADISVRRMTMKLAISKRLWRVADRQNGAYSCKCGGGDWKSVWCARGRQLNDDVYKRHYSGMLGALDVGCWPCWPPTSGETDRRRRIGGALSRWSEAPSIRFNPRDHQSPNCSTRVAAHAHTVGQTSRNTGVSWPFYRSAG